jgi:hypothetical protein
MEAMEALALVSGRVEQEPLVRNEYLVSLLRDNGTTKIPRYIPTGTPQSRSKPNC